MKLALVTCRRLPEPDHDEKPLAAALRALEVDAEVVAWDDPKVDWRAYDRAFIRSTWNYIHHLPAFLAWARRASRATRLMNPYPIVRWNSDKSYLRRLAREGVRIVPTSYGSIPEGWNDVVVKPRVGAGSFMTRRFTDRAAARRFLKKAAAVRPMLVQPYVRSVETRGERSFVYIDGEVTHVIRKSPRLHGHSEAVTGGYAIENDERAFARRVLEPFKKDILYARVDAARDEEGRLMLMELELIEPSLFLSQHPAALERFARACSRP